VSLRRHREQLSHQTHTDLPVSAVSEKLILIHLSTMSVVAEVPSMEMEEMDGRDVGEELEERRSPGARPVHGGSVADLSI